MEILLRLIEQEQLTAEEALRVVAARRASRPPIGKLALAGRLLNVQQIFKILAHCADSKLRFGEAAIQMGLLTKTQTAVLLYDQQNLGASFEEILLEMGLCTPELLERLRVPAHRPPEEGR